MRGSDFDEIRVYDHLLCANEIAALAAKREPTGPRQTDAAARRAAWLHRFGWDHALPKPLDAPVTTIRKVEFADAKDLKEWMWKGVDGIAETTWPGRSEEHTSELQSLMRISYAVFCLKKKTKQ